MIHILRPFRVFSADEPPEGGSLLLNESVSDLSSSDQSENQSETPEVSGDDLLDKNDETEFDGWDDLSDDESVPYEYGSGFDSPPQEFSLNPREQAYQEAQALGRDADWAENRAFEIYEERQVVGNLHANAALHVPALAREFEEHGIPGGAAAPYYENLIKLTRQGFRRATQDPMAQRVALAHAIGEYVIREQAEGRSAFSAREEPGRRSMVTPTSATPGGSRLGLGGLSKQDQRFISQWQSAHNGGKPPTSKQLATLQAEGLIG